MNHLKGLIFAFLCINLEKQVFCGDEYYDHDHKHDDNVPITVLHNPGIYPPTVLVPKNPFGNGNSGPNPNYDPNNPNYQGNTHQRYPSNGGVGGNNNYDDRYNPNQNGNFDGQNNRENYPPYFKDGPPHQLSAAFPEGCDESGRSSSRYCQFTVKLIPNKNKPNYFTFELRGKAEGYIAVGLSEDLLMGDDHIVECVRKIDGKFTHYQSFSKRQLMPDRIPDTPIIDNFHYGYKDGYMTCSFDRHFNTKIKYNDKIYFYDLKEGNHHILLAKGDLKDKANGDEIGLHGKDNRFISRASINEMKKSPYRSDSNILNSSSLLLLLTIFITISYFNVH